MSTPRMFAVLAALVATAVLAGCGSSSGALDQAATQEAVAAAVVDDLGLDPDAAVEATCPADVAATKGERFACTVALGAPGVLPVDVTVTSTDGALQVTPAAAIIDPLAAAAQLKATLKSEFERSFQVDCGDDAPQVRAPRDTFVCRARDKTSRRSVTVTVLDAAGTLRFEVARPTGAEGGDDPAVSAEPGDDVTLELTPDGGG